LENSAWQSAVVRQKASVDPQKPNCEQQAASPGHV
jgi:hypothetical protein